VPGAACCSSEVSGVSEEAKSNIFVVNCLTPSELPIDTMLWLERHQILMLVSVLSKWVS